jgi:argininosuccinate lyase
MGQREGVLSLIDAINVARTNLLKIALANSDAIMPAYTIGVQSQPTTFGHYALGYEYALARSVDRLRESYARVNRCPLGSAVGMTSSFPIDRIRLAELLGFDGIVEHAFDAAQISPLDNGTELVGNATVVAMTVGSFASDLYSIQHHSHPWLQLFDGGKTEKSMIGTSTIMPQKRNPFGLNELRLRASEVDLPLNFHPATIRVSAVFTPSGAG